MRAWANDIVIEARPDAPVGELILSRVRRHWPGGWFQDAEEDQIYRLRDPRVVVAGGRSSEFYIYRDQEAYDAWQRDGATAENLDTMLYFILDDPASVGGDLQEVTLVCGERTDAIQQLIHDLTASFQFRTKPASGRAAWEASRIMATTPEQVADAFEKSGCGWVLKMSDRDTILRKISEEIEEFLAAYHVRYEKEELPEPFRLLEVNPSKAASFFPTFAGATVSVGMRVLVWRLLMGDEIESMLLDYHRGKTPEIRLQLTGEHEPFKSDNLWDFQVLQNLGILAIDGTPILDGYYTKVNSDLD